MAGQYNYDKQNGCDVLKKLKSFLYNDDFQGLFDELCGGDYSSDDIKDVWYVLSVDLGYNVLENMDIIPKDMFAGWGSGVLIIPNNITKLGIRSFSYSTFSKIKVPEGISEIPTGCFSGCKAVQILIPTTCKVFAPRAFERYEGIIIVPQKGKTKSDNISFPKSEIDYYKEHIRRIKPQGGVV